MNIKYTTINHLKNKIYQELNPEVKNFTKCVLFDVPNHNNIGDIFIWEGELEFIKKNKIKIQNQCSCDYFYKNKVDKNTLIFLQGGGNFGDLYKKHQNFRLKIIQKYTNNKILIFPITSYFNNKKYLKKNIEIFSQHSNIVICARDNQTYMFLKKTFTKNKILLVPNMAFILNLNKIKIKKSKKNLYLKRLDKELKTNKIIKNLTNKWEIKDWPGIHKRNLIHKIIKFSKKNIALILIILKLEKVFNVSPIYGIKKNIKDASLQEGIKFLTNYNKIITTRMHAHIIATMLGINNTIIDNSYSKNKNFYNTWTKNIQICKYKKN